MFKNLILNNLILKDEIKKIKQDEKQKEKKKAIKKMNTKLNIK